MKTLLLMAGLLFSFLSNAADLPVKEWQQKSSNTFVLYITGDGGFNKFSNALCDKLFAKGFSIGAVNAKAYFWKKKTPRETADDVAAYLHQKLNAATQLVLVGYSFGADVAPFIVNRLPADIKSKLKSVILLAPSETTDFEVHLSDMLGGSSAQGTATLPEINALGNIKTTIITSAGDKSFPVSRVKLAHFKPLQMAGDHHFDDNFTALANLVASAF